MLQLRRAHADDCHLLAELNEQLIVDEGHDNPMRGEELEDRMRDWLSGGYEAAVGTVDGVPACYALWRPDGANRIHLRQFFVARDQRRLGVGRRVIAALRADHWPSGAQVSLDVLIHNQTGIEFWRSVGFRDYSLTLKGTGSG